MAKTFKTITEFAYALGSSDRITIEEAHAWHVKYVGASEDKQAETRTAYCVAYMQGNMKWTEKRAVAVSEMVRERDTVEYDAYNKAQSNFHYRIVTDSGRAKVAKQKAEIKLSREQMRAIKACKALNVTAAMFNSVK